MIRLKSGVESKNDKAEITVHILLALIVAQSVYHKHGLDFVVTSLVDGVHSANSLHYRDGKGNALDCRTRHIPDLSLKRAIRDEIADALGPQYDVVLESSHIHIEYDPD